jgi:protein-L-isoaspartate(D-aspartate) O-methyltransferase
MPQIMASMLEQLNVQAGHRVLEIGAGTGYNAAVLAGFVGPDGEVTTVDIDEVIVREARDRLDAAGYAAVHTVIGDGWLGAAEQGPYDGIEVTVGVSDLSPAWVAQLRDGGRLVVPLWLARGKQLAIAFQKDGERLRSVALTDCGFMRLRGPHAGSETFVTVQGWTIGLDEADPTRVAALEALLALEPQIEPAPTGQWGWPTRLLLEEPGAIALSRENDWRKYGWGILETAAAEPSLAFVTAQTWDYRLYTFGGDAARSTLLNWLTHARPFDIRHVSIEALPSIAVPPQDAMVLRRRNFQFVIQQRGGTM